MNETEFKIEWLYSNLRWFFLIATALISGLSTLATEDIFPTTLMLLLIIGTVANFMVMILLVLNAFRRPFRFFTLLLDISLALGLIGSTGGTSSPIFFISFIPVVTTALRFSWLTSLTITLAIVALYWALALLPQESGYNILDITFNNLAVVSNGLVMLLAGSAATYLGSKIKQSLVIERDAKEKASSAALDAAHQRVRLIFELASTLSATLNYERVLEAALDVSNAGLREFMKQDIPQVGMILLFGMDQSLYVATGQGLTLTDNRARFPAREGVLAATLQKAEPIVIQEPGSDPELGRTVAMHSCRQAIALPLLAGFESYGLLVLGSPEAATYTPDFQDLLVAVCNQAVMALQNARLYQELVDEKERLVAVEEDARKKLARDLHDGPTQTIAAIAMRLNYIQMLLERDPSKVMPELLQLENLARKTTKEIRQMLFTLRPLILETQGLGPALEQYAQKLAETDPLPIHLQLDADINKLLESDAQGAIFYIVEEAITNARKHAKAKNLWIRIYQRGMSIITEIEDDGKGFDVAKVEAGYAERSSLGMLNLQERASLVGGKTIIQSTPGQGTKVTITVPIRSKALSNVA